MKIANFILNSARPLRLIIDKLTYSSYQNKKYLDFCNSNIPKKVLIVANGPSLNRTPLDAFKALNVYSVGLNKIHLIYDRTDWRPNFVVSVNGLISKQSGLDICENNSQILAPWKNRFFFPKSMHEKIIFFMSKFNKEFVTDGLIVGGTSTVTASALQILYKLGVKTVVIVGMDHNYEETSHANSIIKMKGKDNSHFSKDYFKDGTYWGAPDIQGSEIDYALARAAFESIGGNVFDATIDGKCEVFKKISIDDALNIFEEKY